MKVNEKWTDIKSQNEWAKYESQGTIYNSKNNRPKSQREMDRNQTTTAVSQQCGIK